MAAVTICNDFGAQNIKSLTVSIVSPSICHEVMGPDPVIRFFFFLSFFWVLSQLYTSVKKRIKQNDKAHYNVRKGFLGGPSGEECTCQGRRRERHGFGLWVVNVPWRRKWQPLPYSCQGNPTDREAWWASVHRAAMLLKITEERGQVHNICKEQSHTNSKFSVETIGW